MATFVLEQPGWLAVAVAAVLSARLMVMGGGRRELLLRDGVISAALIGVAYFLGRYGAPGLHGALLISAVAAGGWWISDLYRRDVARLRMWRVMVLVMLRLLAWVIVLILLSRPAFDRRETVWERPVLAVLLDASSSMAIEDVTAEGGPLGSRAARANRALRDAARLLKRTNTLYDIRLRTVGATLAPADDWRVVPEAPLTGLAAGLRGAQALRSARGRPPAAVLVVSDGAETIRDAAAVRAAARELADADVALLAAGVGPRPGETPLVELEPLGVPPRVGLRDLLRVDVRGRTQACTGHDLTVQLYWNDDLVATRAVSFGVDDEGLATSFETTPPALGAHRLTARVVLPESLGGGVFMRTMIVEVESDKVRVLYLDQVPRVESAFALRALAGMPGIEVTPHYFFDETLVRDGDEVASLLAGQDVVVIGQMRDALPGPVVDRLAEAVLQRGVGVLLAGGPRLFGQGRYGGSRMNVISPVRLPRSEAPLVEEAVFLPTAYGRRHPVLMLPATWPTEGAMTDEERPREAQVSWEDLPALGRAVPLGEADPNASVLAVDASGRALLVAQEVGRGRCLAAGWEATWPWALGSDVGERVHRHLWRQIVRWLANRRPEAWVITDQTSYAKAALDDAGQSVTVRAGVTGLPVFDELDARAQVHTKLMLRAAEGDGGAGGELDVPLRVTADGGWVARLPDDIDQARLATGAYELEFYVDVPAANRQEVGEAGLGDGSLRGRTRFEVLAEDLERRPPTANLALLEQIAGRTASVGGMYRSVEALDVLLERLNREDRRRRVPVRSRFEVVDRLPWLWLGALVGVMGVEWAVRKRAGLV